MKVLGKKDFEEALNETAATGDAWYGIPRQQDAKARQESAKVAALVLIANELHETRQALVDLKAEVRDIRHMLRRE